LVAFKVWLAGFTPVSTLVFFKQPEMPGAIDKISAKPTPCQFMEERFSKDFLNVSCFMPQSPIRVHFNTGRGTFLKERFLNGHG
jgi:hypothetical protein